MRVLDLFSGIGGMSLGLEQAGMTTAAFCEIDPFCRLWLRERWPDVPIYDDIRRLHAAAVSRIDIIAGGFPCQDISSAGKGAGIDGEKSGLWREMFRLVRDVRPRWVLAENVPALRTRGADRVLGDLESAGYACWPLVVGADDIGAPHRRKRAWIVACRNSIGCKRERSGGILDRERPTQRDDADRRDSARVLSDTEGGRRPLNGQGRQTPVAGVAGVHRWPAGPEEQQYEWEPRRTATRAEFALGCGVDGIPERLGASINRARLRAFGNSVVPQIVESIGRAIMTTDKAGQ